MTYPPPPFEPPAPPPRRNLLLPVLVGLVALLVFCCGTTATALVAFNDVFAELGEIGDNDTPGRPRPSTPAPRITAGPTPAATPTPTASAATENLRLGRTLTVTTADGRVAITVKTAEARKKGCDDFALEPRSGGYLVADVTVQVLAGTASVSPYDFQFLAPDGTTTPAYSNVASGCGQQLDSVEGLKAGGRRTGQLVFDVSPARGQILYEAFGAGLAGSWKVG